MLNGDGDSFLPIEPTATTAQEWTVSMLAVRIRKMLEQNFASLRVKGELSRITRHSSGHIYFDLKDEDAVIHAAWFKGSQKAAAVALLAQGAEVVVSGRISAYPQRSEYQLIVNTVTLAGLGALLQKIEERKKRLKEEGLFDENRKKKLPFLPQRIGMITSPTGAVIRDMLHRFRDRFMPHVLFWPVTVQGETAADQIRAALEGFQTIFPPVDVIIIARGGGSIEDLMPFNDEALVRCVAKSHIPVVSAIGHETDWTLLDLVADMRAPTPTGAAEMVVPVKDDLLHTLDERTSRLILSVQHQMKHARQRLEIQHRALTRPQQLLENKSQLLDDRTLRLSQGLKNWLSVQKIRLAHLPSTAPIHRLLPLTGALQNLEQRFNLTLMQRRLTQYRQTLDEQHRVLDLLSYTKTLERGFTLALDVDGNVISRAQHAPNDMLLRFVDNEILVTKK